MKSMLHEASSVLKAIEKAWVEAGQPEEFTIRVLEKEKKGFFGFVKEPAVVSIMYSQRKGAPTPRQPEKNDERKLTGDREKKIVPREQKSNDRKVVQPPLAKQPVPEQKEVRRENATARVLNSTPQRQDSEKAEKAVPEQLVCWQDEHVAYVESVLKDLLNVMTLNVSVTSKIDKKMLLVTLGGGPTERKEDERSFCVSLSYLLIQFLKKHYKKKFRGYQLHVAIK